MPKIIQIIQYDGNVFIALCEDGNLYEGVKKYDGRMTIEWKKYNNYLKG